MAFPKFQTKEVLNKVLNTGEDALNVDLAGSITVEVNLDHTDDSVQLWGNESAAGSGTARAILTDSDGHLQVDVLTAPTTAVTGTFYQATQPVSLASAPTTAVTGTFWQSTQPVSGTVTANAGSGTLAVSLASVPSHAVTNGGTFAVQSTLQAADGVDIGNVDVASIVPGYGATNLGKREDDAHSNLDVGVMSLAVRNDAIAAIGAADGDYAPLQVNSAGSLYTKDETGEAGSILVKGTNAVAAGISGTVFIAIQFLEDTVFHDDDGLVASSTQLYPDDAGVGSDISSNGGNTDDVVFPQGMTIFGRWAGFKLASGTVIAYVGYV